MRLIFSVVCCLSLLLCSLSCQAEGVRLLLVDSDPQGTNVRDVPGGKVIDVIPALGSNPSEADLENHAVSVVGQQASWFKVSYGNGKSGWMHASLLGSCSAATEDGNARMTEEPKDGGKVVATLPAGTRLHLIAVQGSWGKFFIKKGESDPVSGWLPEQCFSSNPSNSCWR